jgi:large subunit ribosomal protein L24
MQKIRVKDEVVVISGKDRGKKGEVVSFNKKKSRVVVKGVNLVKKTEKSGQENPEGKIYDKEQSLHISNVQLLDPNNGKPTRVRIEVRDGKNVRVAVKTGGIIDSRGSK